VAERKVGRNNTSLLSNIFRGSQSFQEVYRLAGEFSVFFGWLTRFKQCTVLVKLLWLVRSAENYGNALGRKLETRPDNTDKL
jgi:hypothetical protein